MRNYQKGNVHLIIIIVLIITIVGVLGFTIVGNLTKNNKTEGNDSNKNNSKMYSVGDEISFNDAKWYVIESSNSSQDYVTAIKATYLQKNFSYGDSSDYKTSAARNYLENTYMPTLDKDKLKDVDDYRVRLITIDELKSLGCVAGDGSGPYYDSYDGSCSGAPKWVVNDSDGDTGSIYYTMTSKDGALYYVSSSGPAGSIMAEGGGWYSSSDFKKGFDLRPVINLLKTSIK